MSGLSLITSIYLDRNHSGLRDTHPVWIALNPRLSKLVITSRLQTHYNSKVKFQITQDNLKPCGVLAWFISPIPNQKQLIAPVILLIHKYRSCKRIKKFQFCFRTDSIVSSILTFALKPFYSYEIWFAWIIYLYDYLNKRFFVIIIVNYGNCTLKIRVGYWLIYCPLTVILPLSRK